ncbi:hypothetical protein [Streptomyces pilosus]|uniref:Uncharacterized protein n=1 Tax=Streptomyces pilosus TaxID=28893 RepID=A0A918BZ34_9ACTN|nr:hypothetical protein [Streptomyces pilosus]GGQ97067.1 hypothetical protein GCM10010280_50950 [Streptomyces pilosus]
MDLRALVRRAAMGRPAVLTVSLPGATELRLEAEAEVRRRGWPVAGAPAAADLLVVCGVPAPKDAEWLDRIERSMPEPTVRIVLRKSGQAVHALDAACRELADKAVTGAPPEDAAPGDQPGNSAHGEHQRPGDEHDHRAHHDEPPPEAAEGQDHDDHHTGHDQDHSPHSGHEGHGHQQPADHAAHMDHADHQGHGGHMDHMGHDMHSMGEVAGLPMAERDDDRDALRLDRLHVPIGPGLSDWPVGLILRLTLQGDVLQGVEVDHLPVPSGPRLPYWDEPWLLAAQGEEVTRGRAARRRCAAHLDSAGRLLAVAGWDDGAARCRRLRDELLSGASRQTIDGELRRTVQRIGRSRALRWSIAGLGVLPAGRGRAAGVTGPALAADGDAYDRLMMWLGEIERGLAELDEGRLLTSDELTGPRGRLDGPRPPSQALLDVLPELLTGAEFACARIIVASLDPDIEELALAPASGAAHA